MIISGCSEIVANYNNTCEFNNWYKLTLKKKIMEKIDVTLDELLEQCDNALRRRDKVDATLLAKRAVKLLPSLGDKKEQINCNHAIYRLLEFLKENEEALQYLNNVLAMELEYKMKVYFLQEKALCYMRMKKKEEAFPIFQQILELAQTEKDDEMLARMSMYLAKYYHQEKDFVQSIKYWNDVIGYARKIYNLPMEASAYSSMAVIYYKMKNNSLALECLREAENLAADGGNIFYAYQTALRRCKIYMELGDMQKVCDIINSLFEFEEPDK